MSDQQDQPIRRAPAMRPVIDIGNRSSIVFVTVCAKDRRPVLATEEAHLLLLNAWQQADHFLVGRYVILPDHVHLFACPASQEFSDVRRWVSFWKRLVSRAWPEQRELPIWQTGAWDRQLRSGESYSEKWDYVRSNPVRHQLVERPDAWPFQGELTAFEWHDE